MKYIRFVFLVLIIIACTKEKSDYKSVGTITGADLRMCACCGGWIINIADNSYLFDSLPDDSDLNLEKETFPVTVKLDWQLINSGCSTFNRITVQRIKKI